MRIFLTGGTGFIGSHFLNLALNKGYKIIALRRSPLSKVKINIDQQPLWIDKPLDTLKSNYFGESDILIHLAAHSANFPYDSLENCITYNLNKPLNLFNSALSAGIKKFIVGGTCFEYGLSGTRFNKIPANAPLEPTSSYPTSKAAASIVFLQWAKEKKISLSLLRFFQVYGEGELKTRLYPSLKRAALSNKDFPMTQGAQIRDFIRVDHLVDKILQEVKFLTNENNKLVKIQNIGSNSPKSILEFSNEIWSNLNAKGKLLPGKIPYRDGEIMRYVPCLKPYFI